MVSRKFKEMPSRADQEPINCLFLGSIDLNLWRDNVVKEDPYCYLRVEVNSRMSGITLDSVSRMRGEKKQFETLTSSRDDTVCLPIICPTSSRGWGRVRACVFADNSQNCNVKANRLLTKSSRSSFFRARISLDDIEDPNTGAYMDLQSCESGSAEAATFNCMSDIASVESDEKLLQDLENTLTDIAGSVKQQQDHEVKEVPLRMPEDVENYIEENDDDNEDSEMNTNAQSNEPWKKKTINVLEDLLHTLKQTTEEKEAATDQHLYESLEKLLKDTR